jgi:prepilin-type N-terminal cleavage/methylation domain-containing protein
MLRSLDRMNRSRPSRPPGGVQGFTLLELVIVLAIVAIVAGIAAPRYQASAARYRAESAARRVACDLGLARARARAASASQTVAFSVAAGEYTIVGMSDPDRPAQPYRVVLGEEPYRARLLSAQFGGVEQVTFNGFGVPGSAGSVVVEAGGFQKTVTLDVESGKATVQ